jgi:Domain of unknown function (DUF5658)
MSTFILGRPFPRPSLSLFVALQVLDLLTTMIGLQMGAAEGSVFIGRLIQTSPMTGLLIAKIVAVILVALAVKFRRPRIIVVLNYWSALVVAWNLVMIVLTGFGVTL